MIEVSRCTLKDLEDKLNNEFKDLDNIVYMVYPWSKTNTLDLATTLNKLEKEYTNLINTAFFMFDYNKDAVRELEFNNTHFTTEIANNLARVVLEELTSRESCNIVFVEEKLSPKTAALWVALKKIITSTDQNKVDGGVDLNILDSKDMADYKRIVDLFTKALDTQFINITKTVELEEKAIDKEKSQENTADIIETSNKVYNALLKDIESKEKKYITLEKSTIAREFKCSLLAVTKAYEKLKTDGLIDDNDNPITNHRVNDKDLIGLENNLKSVINSYRNKNIHKEDLLTTINQIIEEAYNSENTNAKRVEAMSKDDIENYSYAFHIETSVVISIRGSGGCKTNIPITEHSGIKDVLYMKFDDTTQDDGYCTPISVAQGNEISDFVNLWIDKVDKIIFQCEYGESCSVGCAEATLEHFFNTRLDENKLINMNSLCYKTLLDAYERNATE